MMCLIANVNRDPKQTPRAWRPADFMPGATGDPTPEELEAKIRAVLGGFTE